MTVSIPRAAKRGGEAHHEAAALPGAGAVPENQGDAGRLPLGGRIDGRGHLLAGRDLDRDLIRHSLAPSSAAARVPPGRARDIRHLDLAIFQRPLGAFRPGRVAVDLEIAPPHRRRLRVPLQPLQEQRHVEHRVGIARIGIERALLAIDRLGEPAAVVEQIGEIVPGRRKFRVRLDGGAVGGLRLDHAALLPQQVAEIEARRRIARIELHDAPVLGFRRRRIALLLGGLRLREGGVGACPPARSRRARTGPWNRCGPGPARPAPGRRIAETAAGSTAARPAAICGCRAGSW